VTAPPFKPKLTPRQLRRGYIGDLLVFVYYRMPRLDNQIVIAADFTSGSEGGEYAVKRFKADPDA